MAYFMGIDNGGTVTKVVIFDDTGAQIASASQKVPLLTPHAGFTERDMNVLWEANAQTIRQAIQNSALEPAQIKGIGCTGHGKGLYLWGKDGKPAYNGIVSTDARAWKFPEQWQKDGTADRVFEKTCQKILACQPVSLLNWFKEYEPAVLENVQWIFAVKDYIRFRLTGEAYAEKTDISGTNLLNLREANYDRVLLKEFGLEEFYEKVPPLRNAADNCGFVTKETAEMTGLCEGTPVAGGMFDIDACAIAMDITNEEHLCVIAGTWSINEYISRIPVLNKTIMMNSLYCIDGYYLVEECSPTSAGNNDWFIDMFLGEEKQRAQQLGKNVYDLINEMAQSVEPEEQDIIFLPYLFGSNYNPRAKACLIGLDSHHTRAQIVRAVYEGIALCHRVHVEKLLMNRDRPSSVRLAGGVVNSQVWSQIFADVFNLPIEIIETKELGTLGCAMAAAVAAGFYTTFEEAAKHMVRIKCRLEPDEKAAAVFDRKFNRFVQTSEALDALWKE